MAKDFDDSQVMGGAGAKKQKSWNQGPAQKRRSGPTGTPPPPVIIPNASGNYTTPSRPPTGGPGAIPQISSPPPLQQYLAGDTTYQNQMRNYTKTLSDFLANLKVQRGKVGEDYGAAQRSMNTQKGLDLKNIENDFSGRGLLTSGLYAGAVGDYNTDFLQKLAELTKQRDRSLAGYKTDETNFRRQQALEQQAAREAAVRRRASQYGI